METQKRITWQDAARGLAILSVAFGHIIENSPYRGFTVPAHHVLYSFHMALFFILSGLLFKVKDGESYIKFIGKRAKSILLPYLLASILLTIWYTVHDYWFPFSDSWQTWRILLMNRGTAWQYYWFLPAMFTAQLLFWPLVKFIKKDWALGVICTVLAALGVVIGKLDVYYLLPLHIDVAMFSLFFLFVGYFFKKHAESFERLLKSFVALIAAAVIFIAANVFSILVLKADSSHYYNLDIGNPVVLFFTALTGSFLFIRFSRIPCFGKSRAILYFGKNSIYFFVFHYFVLWLIGYPLGNLLLTEASPWYLAIPVILLQFIVSLGLTGAIMNLYALAKKGVLKLFRKK